MHSQLPEDQLCHLSKFINPLGPTFLSAKWDNNYTLGGVKRANTYKQGQSTWQPSCVQTQANSGSHCVSSCSFQNRSIPCLLLP